MRWNASLEISFQNEDCQLTYICNIPNACFHCMLSDLLSMHSNICHNQVSASTGLREHCERMIVCTTVYRIVHVYVCIMSEGFSVGLWKPVSLSVDLFLNVSQKRDKWRLNCDACLFWYLIGFHESCDNLFRSIFIKQVVGSRKACIIRIWALYSSTELRKGGSGS